MAGLGRFDFAWGRFPVRFEAIFLRTLLYFPLLWVSFPARFVVRPPLHCLFSPMELELLLDTLRLHPSVHWAADRSDSDWLDTPARGPSGKGDLKWSGSLRFCNSR